jgi:hypothetical protein
MKCDENGGCPFRGDGDYKLEGYCLIYGEVGVSENEDEFGEDNGRLESFHGCHLTSAAFTRLRAELAGTWKCDLCAKQETECDYYWNEISPELDIPCADYQPKEDG